MCDCSRIEYNEYFYFRSLFEIFYNKNVLPYNFITVKDLDIVCIYNENKDDLNYHHDMVKSGIFDGRYIREWREPIKIFLDDIINDEGYIILKNKFNNEMKCKLKSLYIHDKND